MAVKTKPAEMDEQTRPRKSRPQILAGLIIIISFGLFCTIVYFAVSLVSDYLSRSTQTLGADLLVRKGPVYITRAGQSTKILANPQERVEQGDTISGDEESYAQLTLFDGTRLDLTASATIYLRDSKVLTTNFVRKEKKLTVEVGPSGSEEGKPGVGQVVIWPADPYNGNYAGQPVTLSTSDGASLVFDKPEQGNFKIEVQRTADNSSRTIITSPPRVR
jgi:hypothetical protein